MFHVKFLPDQIKKNSQRVNVQFSLWKSQHAEQICMTKTALHMAVSSYHRYACSMCRGNLGNLGTRIWDQLVFQHRLSKLTQVAWLQLFELQTMLVFPCTSVFSTPFYNNAGVLLANPENIIKCVGRSSVSYLEGNSLLTPIHGIIYCCYLISF